MESSLEPLSFGGEEQRKKSTPSGAAKKPNSEVAESWDDDLSDSDADPYSDAKGTRPTREGNENLAVPQVPPSTPISPLYRKGSPLPSWNLEDNPSSSSRTPAINLEREERKRPEKSTAVAGRLIAGALGVKAPKKTEEQRKYDRAVREQEMKKRNRELEARMKETEADEKAKNAVWEG